MTDEIPVCTCCTHFDREQDWPPTCDVFPHGIPLAIRRWTHHHRTGCSMFEQAPDAPRLSSTGPD
jgi:hypothetical protein